MKRTVLMQAVGQNLIAEGTMTPEAVNRLSEHDLIELVKFSTRLILKGKETLHKRFFDILRELNIESDTFSVRWHETEGYPFCTYCRAFVPNRKSLPITHTNLCVIRKIQQMIMDLDK